MRKFVVQILLILWINSAWGGCDDMVAYGMPEVQTTESSNITLLCRKMYVLAHNNERHTAWWSAEKLESKNLGVSRERIDAFRADPDLPKESGADLIDYAGTGFDKGHLAPTGDMHSDPEAMIESFYLSNMVPQLPKNNRVGWRSLESYVRYQAKKRGTLFVITGPIYQDFPIKTIGKSDVAVPSHLYKIIYDPNANEALSFVVPNIPIKKLDLIHFISDLATVEQLTKIKFFPSSVAPIKDALAMWN